MRVGTISVRYLSFSRGMAYLLVDQPVALAAEPDDPAAVLQAPVPEARRIAALPADHHEVRDVDRGLLLDDAALDVLLGVRPGVPFDQSHPLHDDPALLRDHPEDAPALAPALPSDHEHLVVPLHVTRDPHHSTSGASEMIFMNFFSRSSRATGPKT